MTPSELKAKLEAKYANQPVEKFDAMEWLTSGRQFVIDRILQHHDRKGLSAVAHAVKAAVMNCSSEDDALVAMDNVILTHGWSQKKHQAFAEAQLESLKKAVFN